jgi:hypothetical protein
MRAFVPTQRPMRHFVPAQRIMRDFVVAAAVAALWLALMEALQALQG